MSQGSRENVFCRRRLSQVSGESVFRRWRSRLALPARGLRRRRDGLVAG